MYNKYHILRTNDNINMQKYFIFYDTETIAKKVKDEEHLTLKLGWVLFWDREEDKEEWYNFRTKKEYWNFVLDKLNKYKDIIVYAHNQDFDLKIVDGYRKLFMEYGFNITNIYIQGTTFILVVKRKNETLRFYDTFNYAPLKLEDIGEAIGYKKLKIDFNKCSKTELNIYCKRDVEIIYNYIKGWINFLMKYDLSKIKSTSGSLALNSFRHRFYDIENKPIYIHSWYKATKLERESYKGGITDCFKVGVFTEKLYKLDINSTYPYVMKKYKMPNKLEFYADNTTYSSNVLYAELLDKIKDYHIIADCEIELKPEYSFILSKENFNKQNKSIFLSGKNRVSLCTPEIEYILKYGKINKVYQLAIYQKEDLFSRYVDFFYGKRLEFEKEGNFAYALICKIMLNSLYGKFGQKEIDYQLFKVKSIPALKKYHIMEDKKQYTFIHIGNKLYKLEKTDNNSFDSLPALSSMVTAYARMYLIDLIMKAKKENVYYVDTDSLIVNEKGLNNLCSYIDKKGFKELGNLKIEGTSIYSRFLKPKFYEFNKDFKCKGIKKSAKLHYEDKDCMIFSQQQFQRFKTALIKKSLHKQIIKPVIKVIDKKYDKGIIDLNGETLPYNKKLILEVRV